jgi:hypothetical protein
MAPLYELPELDTARVPVNEHASMMGSAPLPKYNEPPRASFPTYCPLDMLSDEELVNVQRKKVEAEVNSYTSPPRDREVP